MVGPGGVMIKSAKVTKAPMMTGGNQHQVQQRVDDGQLGSGQLQGNFSNYNFWAPANTLPPFIYFH